MSDAVTPPMLVMVVGPPAVGKMTVGRAVCARSDFRLFHNHHTIEPLLEIFGYGTPPFTTLNGEFRRRVIEEAAAAGTRLIFTYVWALELDDEAAWVRRLIAPYVEAGCRTFNLIPVAADDQTAVDGCAFVRNALRR